jgi:ABC-type sugar transport system substrate-binding protein
MNCWFRVRVTRETWARGNMNRWPGSVLGVLLLMSAAWTSIGCDSESFVPPRPDELRDMVGEASDANVGPASGAASPAIPSPAKSLELVLAWHSADETEVLKSAALKQGGFDKAKIKIVFLGEKETAARQAALVRESIARHPLALILEPSDPGDPALAIAVREAQDAGITVVLLGRDLAAPRPVEKGQADAKTAKAGAGSVPVQGTQASPGSRPARPPVVVAPQSFAVSAGILVASAVRNAKNGEIPPQKKAVILLDTTSDAFVEPRVAAVRDALTAAGITTIKEIRFKGDSTSAGILLSEFLRATPDNVMIFSVDQQSFLATRQAVNDFAEKRPIIAAGYTADDQLANTTQYGEFAVLAEFAPVRLVRKAVSTAIAAAQGRDVPRRIEVPINIFDSAEKTGLAKASRIQTKRDPQDKSE